MGISGIIKGVSVAIFSTVVYLQVRSLYEVPPFPELEDTWWGPREPSNEDIAIRPFKINVSDEVLTDLQQRLQNALPFQEPLEGSKHNYGLNTNLLQTIVDFWKTSYNWKERENFLNQYPQFTVSIQGLKIHYLHVKPSDSNGLKVLPLLLLHGWPGSVREFYDMIPLLTTPQKGRDFVFEVIVPSLPGFGFSEAAGRPGLGPVQIAVVFKNFMQRLGFEKYYIQGGDVGALLGQHMATLFPEKLYGLLSNACFVRSPLGNLKLFLGSFFPSWIASGELQEKIYPLSKTFEFLILESGYLHLQATKPDTVGVALGDSPVGLAAYILEKFITWTNRSWRDLDDGGLTKKFTFTTLLDNVMIYWVTRSITTTMRLYSENFNTTQNALLVDRIPLMVPSGCARFSHDVLHHPDWVLRDKYVNLIYTSYHEGGHFPGLELPDVLTEDVYKFTEKVEELIKVGR